MTPIVAKKKDQGKNIDNLPDNFKTWMKENQTRVMAASKPPYFVSNNKQMIAQQVSGLNALMRSWLGVKKKTDSGKSRASILDNKENKEKVTLLSYFKKKKDAERLTTGPSPLWRTNICILNSKTFFY